jgi:hypothetical protein
VDTHHFSFANSRLASRTAAGTIAIMALLTAYPALPAFAACEQEAARLCSNGDARCLEDAAKTIQQVMDDCKTPEARKQNAAMWQSTPSYFDGQPHEHAFWRCAAQLCDAR